MTPDPIQLLFNCLKSVVSTNIETNCTNKTSASAKAMRNVLINLIIMIILTYLHGSVGYFRLQSDPP